MTITYTGEVATCRGFGCFLKLLLRWRGSIYKLVWLDLLAFLSLYYLLNMVYRFALDPHQKEIFEAVVQYCYSYSDLIPLSFVLGFYVSIVMTRWWNQYTSIPWPDPIAVFVSAHVHGQDERGRVMRRTVMRYVCLCLTMVLTNISPRVKKRFPNLNNLKVGGLLNENEMEIIESMNKGFPRHSKHWLPIVWATSIITRARKEGRIRDDFAVKTIIDELNKFRGQCGLLISYDTISVPLVYTQVVTLAVYSYFLCSVMGQQWTEGKQLANSTYVNKIDLYFPVFTTLQFFFYMGWLKVAESLINPFGEDDDDFEVNWMVDRNLQVSYLIVDEMHHEHPELIKDQYWDEVFPNELPYTAASERFREEHPEPSTAKIEVSETAAMPTTLSHVRIDDMVGSAEPKSTVQSVNYKFPDNMQEEEADDASGIHFVAGNSKVRPGSSPSLVSLSGTMSRVNTVASVFKRILSREDSRPSSTTPGDDTSQKYRFPGSGSSASLVVQNATTKPTGSLRITDQVIEEVDEQTTITSQRANDTNRPSVLNIFPQGPNSASNAQIKGESTADSSAKNKIYMRTFSNVEPHIFPPGGVDGLLAPSINANTVPNTPIGESTKSLFQNGSKETVEDMEMRSTNDLIAAATAGTEGSDDFERLKAEREKERLERQKQKFVRSVSTAPGAENAPATIVPVVAAVIPPLTTLTTEELPRTDLSSLVEPILTSASKSKESIVE